MVGMLVVMLVFEEDVLRIIYGYAVQIGGCVEENFYGGLNGVWDMHSVRDFVVCLGDFNGHTGRQ